MTLETIIFEFLDILSIGATMGAWNMGYQCRALDNIFSSFDGLHNGLRMEAKLGDLLPRYDKRETFLKITINTIFSKCRNFWQKIHVKKLFEREIQFDFDKFLL